VPGEADAWDFGVGAGFYLDATAEPWATNYRMYSYVTKELLAVVKEHFPALDLTRLGLTGHSMGGHGALTVALKNQGLFKSVSAFAPICHPTQCPWGQKAFGNYLARPAEEAAAYDATALVGALGGQATAFDDILIDVGSADTFLAAGQLLPAAFADACAAAGQKVTLRYQEGYDHSYFFVSTFIDQHIEFHAMRLRR
jgi:S-formylglutathione hydrolase